MGQAQTEPIRHPLEKGRRVQLGWGGKHWPVEILAAAEDTVGVTFPSGEPLGVGALVDIECRAVHGAAIYYMHVVIPPQTPGDGVILRRAASVTYIERRRTWRVPINAPIVFSRRAAPDLLQGHMIDLSAEGTMIETDAPLVNSEVLDLPIQSGESSGAVMSGRVVRIEHARPVHSDTARYGVWFTEGDPEARGALTRFLWARIRELYPKEVAALFPGSSRRKKRKPQASGGETSAGQAPQQEEST
jgi:hypothetical protein